MKERMKLELARIPAKLPQPITKTLSTVGFETLYSYLGDSISNSARVEVKYGDINFEMEADLGNPTRTIQKRGLYEPTVSKKVIDILEPGDSFFDIGASFGYFPLLAAQITEPSLVVGVEPNPETREILEYNNKRVTDGKITISSYFIGKENTEIEPTLTVYSGLPAGESKEIRIQTKERTLDRFVSEIGEIPDIILADIDGGEYSLLRGGKRTLSSHSPTLLLEVHPEILKQKENIDTEQVIQYIEDLGYEINFATTYRDEQASWELAPPDLSGKPFHLFAKPL